MTPPPGALTQRLHELLRDGQWHDREPVLAELIKLVQPGQGYRATEQARRFSSQARERTRERSDNFLIASGRRRAALLVINRNKRVERRVLEDGSRQIRLRPVRQGGPAKGGRFIDGVYVKPDQLPPEPQ